MALRLLVGYLCLPSVSEKPTEESSHPMIWSFELSQVSDSRGHRGE